MFFFTVNAIDHIAKGLSSETDEKCDKQLLKAESQFKRAIVDNIPFTVAMIPIIVGLESQGVNITPLWWALAIGVGLGGNATHIGATANLIVVAESEECDIPGSRITPLLWLQKGLPTVLVSLVVATIVYAGFFEFFL